MNMNWTLKTLTAGSLALLMAACATHKAAAPEPAPAPAPTAPAPAPAPAPDAGQTSAADADAALKAKQMADDKARADQEAADRAAAEQAAQQATAKLGTHTFYFEYDSSELKAADLDSLKAHAAYLAKNSSAKVRVEGNADERGTREYNMALGERRAKAVAAYLTSNGASPDQLTVVSYGKEKPADDGHDEAAWSKNRRVELNYTAGQP